MSEPEHSIAPWQREPYRLWSLWDMQVAEIEEIAALAMILQDLVSDLLQISSLEQAEAWVKTGETLNYMAPIRPRISALASKFALHETQVRYDDLQKRDYRHSAHALAHQLTILLQAMHSDLKKHHFLYLSPAESEFFCADPSAYFGAGNLAVCIEAACSEDLREALRCHGLNCHTAAVFHLCRALEALVVKIVWPSVGSPKLGNEVRPTWGDYSRAIEGVVKEQTKPSTNTWHPERVKFYENLVSDFSKVKDAERATVSHWGKMFGEGRTASLLIHTRELLTDASAHFDDDGNYKP